MAAGADLLTRLIEAGTPAALVAEVAMELAAAQAERNALAERRASDRLRSIARRELLPSDWDARRMAVFDRDGYRCVYCGEATIAPHCDHVVPLSRGGGSDLENLATACARCNSAKGARTLNEWRGS